MSIFRIGYLNYFDTATLTATPVAAATAPVTYLQNDARGLVFQATSVASQEIKGTWNGTGYPITAFHLDRHNLAYSDTVRLQLYSDAAWTTSIWDSTALPAYAIGLFTNWLRGFTTMYFTTTGGADVKSFKITIVASAAALEAARIYLGPTTVAPYNPQYGFVLATASNSRTGRSESGSLRGIAKAKWREAVFDLMLNTEAERAAWFAIGQYCDVVKSFLMSVYPEVGGTSERDFTMMGKFERAPSAKLTGWSQYDFQMKVLEI